MKKSEKLFEAFTELDDDLIENAMPQTDENTEYDIVKPALKMHSWKPWVAGAAVAAAAVGVVFGGMKLFGNGGFGYAPGDSSDTLGYPSGTFESGAFDGPNYGEMIVDWVIFNSAEELVNASDIIVTAKVTDISFELVNPRTGRALTDDDNPKDGELNTIYEIEVKIQYRSYRDDGLQFEKLNVRVMGGLKDYKTDEQLELLKRTGNETIVTMHEPPEIELGEEYLFLLAQFDNALPCLINAPQGVFPLSDPTYRDSFSGASAQDIIDCVTIDPNSFTYANKLENENPHYSAEELVNNEDVICTGTVTNISFKVLDLDTCKAPTENSVDYKVCLFTIYDIELNNLYKGNVAKKFQLVDIGGIRGYKVGEQLAALDNKYLKDKTTIPVWENPPEINIGEEYLFAMRHSDTDKPCFFAHHNQTAFPLSNPTYRDEYSGASVNDIIGCLGGEHHIGEGNHHCEMTITHGNQQISLSDDNYDALTQAVQSLITGCQPENGLTTVLTEQQIKQYGTTGYAIDLVFDDIDAPLAGGGNDKKAQTICHATVLVGDENENSYLSYSYTVCGLDGSTEQHHGGTYLISTTHRWGLLGCIGECSLSHSNCINHHNDTDTTSHHAEPEHTTVTPTTTTPTTTTGTHHSEHDETHH